MSLKRQLKYKYQNLKFSLQTITLPAWLTAPAVRLGLFVFIFIFSAAYIVNITSSATSGYQMHELEKKTLALEMEVKKLEVEIADNSSMSSIASRVAKLNMVEATGLTYLASKDSSVAKN